MPELDHPGTKAPRPTFHERGYDKTYYRNRARVLREETSCWICNKPVDKTLTGRDPDGPTADHVLARAKGGTNDRSNLRLAHLRCNSARTGKERPKRRREPERHPGTIDP